MTSYTTFYTIVYILVSDGLCVKGRGRRSHIRCLAWVHCCAYPIYDVWFGFAVVPIPYTMSGLGALLRLAHIRFL